MRLWGWQRTTFGTWGSQVQILPLRPKIPRKINAFLLEPRASAVWVDSYVDRLHLQLSNARRRALTKAIVLVTLAVDTATGAVDPTVPFVVAATASAPSL